MDKEDFTQEATVLLDSLSDRIENRADNIKKIAATLGGKFYQGQCVGMVTAADKLAPGVLE